jgi:hypothetical protein
MKSNVLEYISIFFKKIVETIDIIYILYVTNDVNVKMLRYYFDYSLKFRQNKIIFNNDNKIEQLTREKETSVLFEYDAWIESNHYHFL